PDGEYFGALVKFADRNRDLICCEQLYVEGCASRSSAYKNGRLACWMFPERERACCGIGILLIVNLL
ncbi:hypothetical protein, partial [Sphingobacterium sp. LRF_L2]|uniref:hypothetical protein n=1 Tax=Sphingobacterium sp. LRF_L2 TaxID=3369421 RepID=UPI003F5F6838